MRTQAKTMIICAILSSAASAAGASVAEAQIVGCRADEQDRHRLLVIRDPKSLKSEVLKSFDGKIVESEPSPKGKFVGAMVANSSDASSGLWTFTLHVIDGRGRTVARVKDAQSFKFSPDERYVAVTTGQPFEGASGFRPDGVRITDLRTKKSWTVPELKDAIEVDWTDLPDDGLTLVAKKPLGDTKVWKYQLAKRRAQRTKWKGIHFSPDGKYYYMTPREVIDAGLCKVGDKEDSCVRTFTDKNEEVKLRLRRRFRRLLGWTGKSGHELLATDGKADDEESMEIDLDTGRMRILKEKLNRKWKTRRGIRLLEKKRGELRMRREELFDEIEMLKKRRDERRRRRRNNY